MSFLDHHQDDNRAYVNLAASEQALLAAASRIYAAWISQGKVGEADQRQWMARAIRQAIAMASLIDEQVRAEGEM
ncbi:MAG: hypothetical protein LPK85_05915 [Gammaproteobacteria bacterium]|nr:hypothetical protein [Gammaproteobacteria bacterium]